MLDWYFQEEKNPMMQEDILTWFFAVCPAKDLATFRLVCKRWNKESEKYWKMEAVLHLNKEHFHNGTNFVLRQLPPRHPLSIDDYMRMRAQNLCNIGQKPYHKFELKHCFADEEETTNFIRQLGRRIKKIVFSCCTFHDGSEIETIVCERLVNLQECLIANAYLANPRSSVTNNGTSKDITIPDIFNNNLTTFKWYGKEDVNINWSSFAPKLPKLKHLHVEKSSYEFVGRFLEAFVGAREIVSNSNYQLQSLDIIDASQNEVQIMPVSLIQKIISLGPSLTVLKIDVGHKTTEKTINELLITMSRTLVTLAIFRAPYSNPLPFFLKGAPMSALKHLELHGNVAKSINFLRQTPALETLKLLLVTTQFGAKEKRQTLLRGSEVKSKPIQHDVITAAFYSGTNMSTVCLRNLFNITLDYEIKQVFGLTCLKRWSPNIKYLKVRPVSRNFEQLIRSQWPNITITYS